MKLIENQTLDQERALYGVQDVTLRNIRFDGPADGESALKECSDVVAENTFFNLRYPCWHDHYLTIRDSELTEGNAAPAEVAKPVDPVEPDPTPSVVLLSDEQLVNSATQSSQ